MSVRRLSVLQWLGIGGGGIVWITAFLAGAGVSQAACNPGSSRWGIPHDTVEITLTAVACTLIALAEVAAFLVFRATRDVGEQDPPPQGRLHFFASAALVANVVFFMVILLSGIATTADVLCQQS
jgi:hypothetical protein